MGEEKKPSAVESFSVADNAAGSNLAGARNSAESEGQGTQPCVDNGKNSEILIKEIEELKRERKEMEAALQAEKSIRSQAEKAFGMSAVGVWMQLHAQAEQERSAKMATMHKAGSVTGDAERKAALKQLNEEKMARLNLEAQVKRLIADIKPDSLDKLSQGGADDVCTEVQELQGVARQLRSVFQVEHTRRQKAEGSLEVMLNEVALMDKRRLSLEAEIKELHGRLRNQTEFERQMEAVREDGRKEIDLVTRRAREEIDEECRQRIKAEGALDEMLKEITENELARRKAENVSQEALHSLDAERLLRQKTEVERRKLEVVAHEHHRCRSQAEAANSQLRADVAALRKDCDHLRQILKEEKQQREFADSAWKETARRLHGERAMHAYWVKKQQGCLDKDRLESSDRSQQDADTDWMDKGLVDSRAPKTSGPSVGSLAMCSAVQNDWDASQRITTIPSNFLVGSTVNEQDLIGCRRWHRPQGVGGFGLSHSIPEVKLDDCGAVGMGKCKGSFGKSVAEGSMMVGDSALCKGRFNWLQRLSPLRPARWVFNCRRDAAYHAVKVLRNFWTWVIVVGVVAGSMGLGDKDIDNEGRRSGSESTFPSPCRNHSGSIRDMGIGCRADSFRG